MSSEITRLSDLQRALLHALMDAWQPTAQGQSDYVVDAPQLADTVGAPAGQVREALELLETLGFVQGPHSQNDDPTLAYKGIDEHAPLAPVRGYFISDNGKRAVLTQMLDEGGAQATA